MKTVQKFIARWYKLYLSECGYMFTSTPSGPLPCPFLGVTYFHRFHPSDGDPSELFLFSLPSTHLPEIGSWIWGSETFSFSLLSLCPPFFASLSRQVTNKQGQRRSWLRWESYDATQKDCMNAANHAKLTSLFVYNGESTLANLQQGRHSQRMISFQIFGHDPKQNKMGCDYFP